MIRRAHSFICIDNFTNKCHFCRKSEVGSRKSEVGSRKSTQNPEPRSQKAEGQKTRDQRPNLLCSTPNPPYPYTASWPISSWRASAPATIRRAPGFRRSPSWPRTTASGGPRCARPSMCWCASACCRGGGGRGPMCVRRSRRSTCFHWPAPVRPFTKRGLPSTFNCSKKPSGSKSRLVQRTLLPGGRPIFCHG